LLRKIQLQGSVSVSGDGFTTFTCHTDSDATLNGANKYNRLIAGKTSGTPDLMTYYLNTDSGEQTSDGVTYTSQNAANLLKACVNQDCTSTYDWDNYNKALPTSTDSRFGLSIEDVTNSDDDFSMIFALKEPYTVSEVAPKIDIAFGTTMSLNADTSNGTSCFISPYYVKSEITITD
jgi:hypothetical protein